MENFDGRHVCMSDLENYLKKDEYLDGYTEPELLQVRMNIGAIGREDISEILEEMENLYISAPYKTIESVVKESGLKVGYRYAINDFATVYKTDLVHISSNQYIIVLTAISENKFDPRVAILSKNYPDSYKWIVEYDFESELIDDVYTKGKIVYLKDNNNNSAYYDFKSVKFSRTKEELSRLGILIDDQLIDLYTFNTSDFEEASENFNVKNNQFDRDCYNNVFIGNNSMDNIFKAGFYNNTFTNVCQNNVFGFDTLNNNFKDGVMYFNGNVANKDFIDLNYTDNTVSKLITKSNEGYVLSYLDPDTLALLMFPL